MSGATAEVALAPGHGDLEPLVAIAQVGQPQEAAVGHRHTLAREPRVRLALQLVIDGGHAPPDRSRGGTCRLVRA